MQKYILKICQDAVVAARQISQADTLQKNLVLELLIEELQLRKVEFLKMNQADIELAKKANLPDALMDRLLVTEQRYLAIQATCQQVRQLPDPIRSMSATKILPSGLHLSKMRMPFGVIGIIYESRPNVTIDAAILALKSGNATILKGGSEALQSNCLFTEILQTSLHKAGLNKLIIQSISTNNRSAVTELLKMHQFVDILIPRGGKNLVKKVHNEATMPVIKHLDGVCHVYIDVDAEDEKAIAIADNAKTRRYGVCNAMETLLVHHTKTDALGKLVKIYTNKNVELRGCAKTTALFPQINLATEQDWSEEYLAPILAIKIVANLDEAINHINHYGSSHTDAIVTNNITNSNIFVNSVDSSSVLVNASTSFADGFEYGLGAEVGISTDKFHVRGPVGLEGLTTEKYVVIGDGHCRA